MKKAYRTRFAPSPTGFVHVGNIRTALFAWLIARQSDGSFILRLEDTDKVREVEGSGEHIMRSLKWLGLTWDEGLEMGGPHAPYKQSERLSLYKEWALKLVAKGRAYADPYTPEEVEAFRQQAKAAKKPFLYRDFRPSDPPEWDGKRPLRFLSDPKSYTWQDAVMGELHAGEDAIDDFILVKSDGYPTYNFAHIIDDYLMECTHVTRSQEFLASVPKYLNLYEALEITPPILATFPFVMGADGKKKLSKRDGAKDILAYAAEGYLPETLVNFMASLGWNDGSEKELFTIDELIEAFDLSRVQKSGARFDEQRLIWMNGSKIRGMSVEELYGRIEKASSESPNSNFWPAEAKDFPFDYKLKVLSLVQERLKFFSELPALTLFFFKDLPVDPSLISSHKQLSKLPTSELKELLTTSFEALQNCDFSVGVLTDALNELLTKTGQKPAVLFSLIRIATTQAPASPSLAETLAVIGKEKSLKRVSTHIQSLQN